MSQLLERRRQGHWCLSLAVPRHTVVDSISSPHPWYLNHKGERFISLLGEEGGSCLSERACWIKGVISPEGGIWVWVSLKTALILTQPLPLHVAREPQLWLLPLSPFPHVILSVFFYPPPPNNSSSSVLYAPSSSSLRQSLHTPFLLPLLVQCCPTGNGELRGSVDGCYSNHTSDVARVQ